LRSAEAAPAREFTDVVCSTRLLAVRSGSYILVAMQAAGMPRRSSREISYSLWSLKCSVCDFSGLAQRRYALVMIAAG
jgi:hypothetical protein